MMLSDRIFKRALIFSIICHIFFFYNWPPLRNLSILKPPLPEIEVTYQPERKVPVFSELIDEKQKIFTTPIPAAVSKADSPSIKTKDAARPVFDLKRSDKPHIETIRVESNKELASVSSDDEMLISHDKRDFSDEPTYLNYYNAVRARIYKAANAYKPNYYTEGDVRAVFTLGADGSLISTAILIEGSSTNPKLRNHALMSIKKASPYPPFHASMKESQLTLRLTISFER
ncbi:MAG: hypothetical protein ABH843_07075 [Candidatus Omnitrophota bacterium]